MSAPQSKHVDAVRQSAVAVLILVACAVFATQLDKIYVEPSDAGIGARGLPLFILTMGTALATILLARNVLGAARWFRSQCSEWQWAPLARVAALAAIAFVYVWAITLFQYALPTAVAMSAMLYLFGCRGVRRLMIFPIVAVAAYWIVFFVFLGMFEEPGSLLNYDSYSQALRIRQFIGLQ